MAAWMSSSIRLTKKPNRKGCSKWQGVLKEARGAEAWEMTIKLSWSKGRTDWMASTLS